MATRRKSVPVRKKISYDKTSGGADIEADNLLDLPEDTDERLQALKKLPRNSLFEKDKFDEETIRETNKRGRNGKFSCKRCKKKMKTSNGLAYHMQNVCVSYTCRVCGQKYHSLDDVVSHISKDHLKESTGTCSEKRITRARIQSSTYIVKSEIASDDENDDLSENYIPEQDAKPDKISKTVHKSKPTRGIKHSKPLAVISTSPASGQSLFATIQQPFKEVMSWLHDFLQILERKYKISHKSLTLTVKELILDDGFDSAILRKSPAFQITTKMKGNIVDASKGLEPLTSLDSSAENSTLTFNVGGPVWAMSWCPMPLSYHGSKQYIAIAAHSGLHSPELTYSESGLIQIWDCGVLNPHNCEDNMAEFLFGFTVKDAPVWELKWCRIGGRISPNSTVESDSDIEPRLGILAAACASGKVLIYVVPDPDSVAKVHKPGALFKSSPNLTLMPSQRENMETFFGQCMSVDWTLSDGGQFIAAGYAKGLIALWNMQNPSTLLLSESAGQKELFACHTFHAHNKPIRSLCWCPYASNILASVSDDRFLKFWDRSHTESPVISSTFKTSCHIELCWPMLWCGVFTSTDEVFVGPWLHGVLYHDILLQLNPPFAAVPFKSMCWTLSHSDWLNCIVGGDATGLAVIHTGSNWSRRIHHAKIVPRIQLFTTTVKWENENDKFIFHDTDFSDMYKIEKKPCFKNVRLQDLYPSTACDKPYLSAINKIRWNPNFGSHTWIASGLQCGLVRLHCIDAMHYTDFDEIYNKLTVSSS